MTFNDSFDDFMSLYVEGYNPNNKAYNRTPEEQAEIDKKKAQFKKNSEKLAKEEPIPTIGTTGGASPEPRKRSEDCESCGCSDEEVEDCETCGCEENPEYGHFDDKFSDYIDQYEEPAEDGERVDKDKMKCNSPKRGGSKKFVVKACENGKEKVVRFGDPNMRIRKSNPKARKSFRARHKCDQKKSKFSAGYWSCKKW
tara:strand:+ start:417 stop:1010 length:594 start_codon:yes stop_codon:yes gene_type:complete